MAFTDSEAFTLVTAPSSNIPYSDYLQINSGKRADADVPITTSLRKLYPELNLTVVPASNCPLMQFAAAGFATAVLDTDNDTIMRWRGYVPPAHRGGQGAMGDAIFYAKYHYSWAGEDFILYTISTGSRIVNYILKEPDVSKGEDALSHCAITDRLILTAVKAAQGNGDEFVYVYDGYWARSKELYLQIQKASWDKVILDDAMKKALTSVSTTFFDSEAVYKKYEVPWRRGLIFHGPPGNGKTVSLKALMHQLYSRKKPIPTLYVKAAPRTYDIGQVFSLARQMSPCLLIMEDVETIVTQLTRSYFFNEVDGLENNNGIMMIASTNYLEKLDPGLTSRPSRFDRKYLFPLPSLDQREAYAIFWRGKLARSNAAIDFPAELCPAFAKITHDFSFAFMQEAFVVALLSLARKEVEEACLGADGVDVEREHGDNDPLGRCKLWIALKHSVGVLRKDLESGPGESEMKGMEFPYKDQLAQGCMDLEAMHSFSTITDAVGAVSLAEEAEPVDPARFWTQHTSSSKGRWVSTEEMARHGIGKDARLAEKAFELS